VSAIAALNPFSKDVVASFEKGRRYVNNELSNYLAILFDNSFGSFTI